MKTNFPRIIIVSILAFIFLFLSALAQNEKREVKVTIENASIRLKPDLTSEIIGEPAIGTVFEVEDKIGRWYEIKYRSEIGVIIIGYIHEMFVELVSIREAPQKTTQFELVISGGYNLGYSISQSLSYSHSFSYGAVQEADQQGIFTQDIEKPLGLSVALNYYFEERFGVQLRADFYSKVEISGASAYDLTYVVGDRRYRTENEWITSGDVTYMGFGGNIIFKPSTDGMIAPVISGGVSYYLGNLKVDTYGGWARIFWLDEYRYIMDYQSIPNTIDVSINGIGFNVGGGVDIFVTPNIGIKLDARYFMNSKVEAPLKVIPGRYTLELRDGYFNEIDQNIAESIQRRMPAFELAPSFFKFSVGLVFKF